VTVLQEIRAKLQARADATYLKAIERLVPGVKTIGVRVPQLKALSAELHKAHAKLTDDALWALMDALCSSKVRDEILLGVFLIARRRKAIAPWSQIERWTKSIDNWETCDQLATVIVSPRMANEPGLQKELLGWAKSADLWRRRMAVATTVGLNQKGRSNPEVALKVCEPLLADPEPMVRKAVGWALREVSEHDPKLAFAFLEKNAARCHKSVLREGSQKLSQKQRDALLG
jgi:3-methyladenine DNA glycosylase AlkD